MEVVQSSEESMLIIECNDEASSYVKPTKFRYIKRDITAIKSNVGTTQASEFEICDSSGTKMSRPTGTTITTNHPGNNNEGIEKLIDGSTSTKYCTGSNPEIIIIIDVGAGNVVDIKTYSKYKRYTANDMYQRDPNTWKIYGSKDGTTRTELSSVENANVTGNRNTLAGTRDLSS